MQFSTSVLALGALVSGLYFANMSEVQAAPPFTPTIHFGLNFGPNNNQDNSPNSDCLSDHEIMHELRAQGYHQVEEVDQTRDTLVFDASMGVRMYELEVDSCSGDILSKHRLRH